MLRVRKVQLLVSSRILDWDVYQKLYVRLRFPHFYRHYVLKFTVTTGYTYPDLGKLRDMLRKVSRSGNPAIKCVFIGIFLDFSANLTMEGSFSEVASHAFQAGLTYTSGGDLSFIITSDSAEVVNDVCRTAVRLGAMYTTYRLLKPPIDAAVTKAFGGNERDDQNVESIRPGCLHVLLRCLTDKRFLQVLEDYKSGKIKRRLDEELLKVEIKTKGLTIKIESMEEVEERKEAIENR